MAEKTTIKCPYCNSKNTKKEGLRKSKQEIIQKYFCKDCNKNFTNKRLEHKTHPAKIILKSISYYNLGHTQEEVSKLIAKQYKTKLPQKTISNWINEYKHLCTFQKLRDKAIKLYKPNNIIFKKTLYHIQPYTFQYHKAKLELLFKDKLYNNQFTNQSRFYEPIKSYLEKIPTKEFPHHIFKQKQEKKSCPNAAIAKIKNINKNKPEQRASQLKFQHLKITHLSKNNLANKLTSLALNLAKSNKDRHNAVQDFFLTNDSTTIATEVPVYLTQDDITYFISRKFNLPLHNQPTPITGHIDILQIRNGLIHILDYKPEANKQNPTEQLTIYALALASRTKLDLRSFKAAWFDENNYYEFFPLHAVYPKK